MVTVYTDGGCSGNPGPGGWAFVVIGPGPGGGEGILAEGWGAEKNTTNNRMELTAVISALKHLKAAPEKPGQLTVYTDSQYVQKGISGWIHAWKKNSWRTSGKQPVKNQDLWMELDALAACFPVNWKWVKGHAGDTFNERCDALVQNAIASI